MGRPPKNNSQCDGMVGRLNPRDFSSPNSAILSFLEIQLHNVRPRFLGKPGQHHLVADWGKAGEDLPSNQACAGSPLKREARVTRIKLEDGRSCVGSGQQCDRVPLTASRPQTIPRRFESIERGRPAADVAVSSVWPNKQLQGRGGDLRLVSLDAAASTNRTSRTCGPICSRASDSPWRRFPLNRKFSIVTSSTACSASKPRKEEDGIWAPLTVMSRKLTPRTVPRCGSLE